MKKNLLFILAFMFVSATIPAKELILDKKDYIVNNNMVSSVTKYNPIDVYGILNFLMQYSQETKKWNYEKLGLNWNDIYNALLGRSDNLIDKLSSNFIWEERNGFKVLTSIKLKNIDEEKKLTGNFNGKYFIHLEYLYIQGNELTSIDVSKNPFLVVLNCEYNQINTLKISNNGKLKSIECNNNKLTFLDVSNNIYLQKLICDNNQLTNLNLSNTKRLGFLHCKGNNLKALDVSDCSNLDVLNCNENQLTSIDVTKNLKLTRLDCSNNSISTLDLSNNLILYKLSCDDNQLSKLDLSKNYYLYELSCNNNQLPKLDLSNNYRLRELRCSYNKLASLYVTMDNIAIVSCSHNLLKYSTFDINTKGLIYLNITPQETTQGGSKSFYEIIDLSSDFKSKNGGQTYYSWYDKATGLPVTMYAYNGRFIAGSKNAGKTLICKMIGGPRFGTFELEYEVTIQKISPFSAKSLINTIPENFKLIGGQENETESIQLTPNPVIDILKINTAAKVTSASVYNYAGKEVKRYPRVINNELDLQDLSAGIYIVNLATDQGILSKKIIKK